MCVRISCRNLSESHVGILLGFHVGIFVSEFHGRIFIFVSEPAVALTCLQRPCTWSYIYQHQAILAPFKRHWDKYVPLYRDHLFSAYTWSLNYIISVWCFVPLVFLDHATVDMQYLISTYKDIPLSIIKVGEECC